MDKSIDFQAPSQSSIIQRAAYFAITAHRDQIRKVDGQPYFFHPLAVGRLLLEAGAPPELVAAGILHDTVEDTSITLGQIEEQFGEKVADWVASVTEQDKSKPWRDRKEAYLTLLATAEPEVVMISLADKRDNLRSLRTAVELLGPGVWSKFNQPKPDQRWYHQSLLSIYSDRVEGKTGLFLLEALRRDFTRLFDH